jgi:hypothetical protein
VVIGVRCWFCWRSARLSSSVAASGSVWRKREAH